mgnify:CR=1 FL=1
MAVLTVIKESDLKGQKVLTTSSPVGERETATKLRPPFSLFLILPDFIASHLASSLWMIASEGEIDLVLEPEPWLFFSSGITFYIGTTFRAAGRNLGFAFGETTFVIFKLLCTYIPAKVGIFTSFSASLALRADNCTLSDEIQRIKTLVPLLP